MTPLNAVLYARFSPRPDANESDSIEKQNDRCAAYCRAMNWTIIGSFDDKAASGGSTDGRPGLAAAIEKAKREKAALVVFDVSRLARNTIDALEIAQDLERAGARLVSVTQQWDTGTPTGKLMFTLLAAFAEMQREEIRQRTARAMQKHAQNGRKMSRCARFGYRLEGKRQVVDQAEQAVIARIMAHHAQGLSSHAIAKELIESKTPCRGATWYAYTIDRLIRRQNAQADQRTAGV